MSTSDASLMMQKMAGQLSLNLPWADRCHKTNGHGSRPGQCANEALISREQKEHDISEESAVERPPLWCGTALRTSSLALFWQLLITVLWLENDLWGEKFPQTEREFGVSEVNIGDRSPSIKESRPGPLPSSPWSEVVFVLELKITDVKYLLLNQMT